MGAYLLIGVVVCLCAVGEIFDLFSRSKARLLSMYLIFCSYLLSFLRWEVGTDWDTYLAMFEHLRSFEDAASQNWWGPAYAYLAVVVNDAGLGYTFFLWVIATVALAGKILLVLKVERPLIAVFVLYCLNFNDLFFVRQHVAAIFIGLAVLWLFERKYWLAFLSIAVCFAFHATAMPVFFIALAVHLHGTRLVKYFYGAAVVVTFIAFTFFGYDLLVGGYASYLSGDYAEGSKENSFVRMLLKYAFWLIIFFAHYVAAKIYTQRYRWEPRDLNIVKVVVAVLLLSLVGVSFSEAFSRFTLYIYPLMAILFASKAFLGRGGGRGVLLGANLLQIAFFALLLVNMWFALAAYESLYVPFKFVEF